MNEFFPQNEGSEKNIVSTEGSHQRGSPFCIKSFSLKEFLFETREVFRGRFFKDSARLLEACDR